MKSQRTFLMVCMFLSGALSVTIVSSYSLNKTGCEDDQNGDAIFTIAIGIHTNMLCYDKKPMVKIACSELESLQIILNDEKPVIRIQSGNYLLQEPKRSFTTPQMDYSQFQDTWASRYIDGTLGIEDSAIVYEAPLLNISLITVTSPILIELEEMGLNYEPGKRSFTNPDEELSFLSSKYGNQMDSYMPSVDNDSQKHFI